MLDEVAQYSASEKVYASIFWLKVATSTSTQIKILAASIIVF